MNQFCLSKDIRTNDENRLHNHICDDCLVEQRSLARIPEGGAVRHDDGNVKGPYENQPIPAGFEHSIMRQNETRFFNCGGFVLGHNGRSVKKVLQEKEKNWQT